MQWHFSKWFKTRFMLRNYIGIFRMNWHKDFTSVLFQNRLQIRDKRWQVVCRWVVG